MDSRSVDQRVTCCSLAVGGGGREGERGESGGEKRHERGKGEEGRKGGEEGGRRGRGKGRRYIVENREERGRGEGGRNRSVRDGVQVNVR